MTRKPENQTLNFVKVAEKVAKPHNLAGETDPKPAFPVKQAKRPEKTPVSTYLPPHLPQKLTILTAKLTLERGVRVTVADLYAEAVELLLAKYGEK